MAAPVGPRGYGAYLFKWEGESSGPACAWLAALLCTADEQLPMNTPSSDLQRHGTVKYIHYPQYEINTVEFWVPVLLFSL
jgi:hypothetical protein